MIGMHLNDRAVYPLDNEGMFIGSKRYKDALSDKASAINERIEAFAGIS